MSSLPQVIARPVALKLELFQHTASFKARGAFANLAGRKIPEVGIAAASGGNHGAAAAYAAREFGVPARIFVPLLASPAKVARIRSYGADIVQDGPTYYEALDKCMAYVAQSGALNVHAYDEEPTLLGQGTLGLEIEEQVPDLDTLLVAVGGGGLIGGIAAWFHGKVKIVAVEPETCNSLHAAMMAGEPVTRDALRHRRRFAWREPRRQAHVSDRQGLCRQRRTGQRCRYPQRTASFVGELAARYRARRRDGARGTTCPAATARPNASVSAF